MRMSKGGTMNAPKAKKLNLLQKIVVSFTLLLDGVGVAGLAYAFLLFMVMLDPVGHDVETKFANIRWGEIIYLAGLVVLAIFILSAIFWWLGKRVGKVVATSLCIFSLCTLSTLPLLLYTVVEYWPILIFVGLVVVFNIISLRFLFAKASPASSIIPEKEPESSTTP
jgi:hypothetical protein